MEDFIVTSPKIDSEGNFIFNNWSVLVKTNLCGDPIWVNQETNYKQSIETDHEGNFWVPAKNSKVNPKLFEIIGKKWGNFEEDQITKTSKTGESLYIKSLVDIFFENNLSHLIFGQSLFIHDPFHLTDIQPVLKDGKYWKKGDLFLNVRNMSLVILYRPQTGKIINVLGGKFSHQQEIDIISDTEIGILNNNRLTVKSGTGKKILNNQFNKYILYDFNNRKYKNFFEEKFKIHEIKTESDGTAEILNDNSFFVEESLYGRILLFNRNGKLIFEYLNKDKNNKLYPLYFSSIIEDQIRVKSIKNVVKNSKCKKK